MSKNKKPSKIRHILMASRLPTTIILILFQLAWIYLFFLLVSNRFYWVSLISVAMRIVFAFIVVGTTRNSAYKIGWLILILTFSLFGCVFYLIYGLNVSNKKLTDKIKNSTLATPPVHVNEDSLEKLKKIDFTVYAQAKYLANVGYTVYENTAVDFYNSGEKFFPAFYQELEKAEKYIFLEVFIIQEGQVWERIREILLKKAEQGVKVKLIYDDMGCTARLPSSFYKSFSKQNDNIECVKFNKISFFLAKSINNRDHRKIFVIDGKVAFTGGMNFSDEYANITSPYGYWKDHMIRLEGDAVNAFTNMFLRTFNAFAKGQTSFEDCEKAQPVQTQGFVLPFGTNPFDKSDIVYNVYKDLINRSTKNIYISTPYLVPDDEIVEALRHSAQKGVDVRILTPAIPDKKFVNKLTRANYYHLMQAGVKIYFYTPGFNHAKTLVVDNAVAVTGSVNFDYVSMFLNFESATIMYKTPVVADFYAEFEKLFEESALVTEKDVKTGVMGRLSDRLLKSVEMLF